MKKVMKRILLVVMILIIFVVGASLGYLNDYYHADDTAMEALTESGEIEVINEENERIVYEPENATRGIIFYPGGKVQYEAYAPLMKALSERGILCVLLHMPGNLAVLDSKAADGVMEDFPEISSWYMAGHSLGGAMASSYVADHVDEFDGLILLAAYSTVDLSETDLKILSIYGSEDQVLSMDKYEKARGYLGDSYEEVIIEGGCHAGFGDYGAQEGDGNPTISSEEQQEFTADKIFEFLN